MASEELEKLIDVCLNELSLASRGECAPERAERNAALFLEVQLKLADYIADAEFKARMAKNEVERLASQKYFEFKNGALGTDKKLTEAALEHAISKDEEVLKVKADMLKFEAEFRKWGYIINTFKDGHVFYRTLSKNNSL